MNDVHGNDLEQGSLRNCWLLAAVVAVACVPDYIERIVPHDQTFEEEYYAGIFRFRFWRFGEWIEVVVDDQLPVHEHDNTLYFSKNNNCQHEMFVPLLEKAYAKLNMCYEFLNVGNGADALVDLIGGVREGFKINKPKF